jgi:hypothetical protein
MDIMNIIMMCIINRYGRDKLLKYPHRVLESEIRNEAPRDDEAGLTGSLAPYDAGISEGKLEE